MVGFVWAVLRSLIIFVLIYNIRGAFNEDPGAKFCILYILLAPTITVLPILRNQGGWSLLAEITVEICNLGWSPLRHLSQGQEQGIDPFVSFSPLTLLQMRIGFNWGWEQEFWQLKYLFSGSTRPCSGKFLRTLEMLKENDVGIPVYRSYMGNVLSSCEVGQIFIILI